MKDYTKQRIKVNNELAKSRGKLRMTVSKMKYPEEGLLVASSSIERILLLRIIKKRKVETLKNMPGAPISLIMIDERRILKRYI